MPVLRARTMVVRQGRHASAILIVSTPALRQAVAPSNVADASRWTWSMPEGPLHMVNAHQPKPTPQRIPGRLRSRGPLSEPNVLLEPMDSSDLESWESGPVMPEAPQP